MRHPREEWHLDTRLIGRRVLVFDRLNSTNNFAASLPDDLANDGIVIVADTQSAGRGQHGRSWQCPPGAGVLLSALLYPPQELRRPVLLAAWAAVAVCETIDKTIGMEAQIKWPNDVLIQGRKVCGILIEQGRGTVVGIGLNVNQTEAMFAAAGLPQASSLGNFVGHILNCQQVTRSLIEALDVGYDHLCQGDRSTLEAEWKSRLGLLGKPVAVECHEGLQHGRLLQMTWSSLELQAVGGGMVTFAPEAVRHIEAVPAT